MPIAAALIAACITAAPPDHVILIMTDDQGYGDFGVHGNPVLDTPHLDDLARDSATLDNFYVSPVCAPTRASLMTGRYNYRTRAIDTYLGRAMMDPAEVTIAESLRESGWATGIFGKWHLGDCPPMRAMDQGFERSVVHRGGGIGQSSDMPGYEGKYTDPMLFVDGTPGAATGYCTDLYFTAAIDWIERAHADGRPSFTYIATNAPHGPFGDVPTALYEKYRSRDLANSAFPETPGHALPETADLDRRARIFAMIENVDENVGRLRRRLEALGIADNTLVIFMIDNGPNGRRYVNGFRAMKGSVYEGGIRSPFFACWPKRLEPGAASDRIAAHIDVMPTVLDACDVALPSVKVDGRSLLPLLEREESAWPDRAIIIQAHRGNRPQREHHVALRTQDWKLVHASGFGRERFDGEPAYELYDMRADPLELRDLADAEPGVVERLRFEYDAWFDDVSATRPDNYAPPAIALGTTPWVTLTRQDWRRRDGAPGNDWIDGGWHVEVPDESSFVVMVRFRKAPAVDTPLNLRIGEKTWTATLPAGAIDHAFIDVKPSPGACVMTAILDDAEGARTAHQIEVVRPDH